MSDAERRWLEGDEDAERERAQAEEALRADRELQIREAVAESIRGYCCMVDEKTLLQFIGAIAAQIALRRADEFDSPAAVVRDLLEKGAFEIEGWPTHRQQLKNRRRLLLGRYVTAGVGMIERPAGSPGSPEAN